MPCMERKLWASVQCRKTARITNACKSALRHCENAWQRRKLLRCPQRSFRVNFLCCAMPHSGNGVDRFDMVGKMKRRFSVAQRRNGVSSFAVCEAFFLFTADFFFLSRKKEKRLSRLNCRTMECGDTAVAGTIERRATYRKEKLSAAFAADNEVDMKEKRPSWLKADGCFAG